CAETAFFPTRRSSDLVERDVAGECIDPLGDPNLARLDYDRGVALDEGVAQLFVGFDFDRGTTGSAGGGGAVAVIARLGILAFGRSEEHTSELQSRVDL